MSTQPLTSFNKFSLQFLLKYVPVHFISVSGKENSIDEITIVTKPILFNCDNINQYAVSIPSPWTDYKQEIKNQINKYVTSTNEYGIVVYFPIQKKTSETSPIMLLHNLVNETFLESNDKILCIDHLSLIQTIFEMKNINFDSKEIEKMYKTSQLMNYNNVCPNHKEQPEICSYYRSNLLSNFVQWMFKQNNIHLENVDKMFEMNVETNLTEQKQLTENKQQKENEEKKEVKEREKGN